MSRMQKVLSIHEREGVEVISVTLFSNGYKVLEKFFSGTLVCCWEVDGEYFEDCNQPEITYRFI